MFRYDGPVFSFFSKITVYKLRESRTPSYSRRGHFPNGTQNIFEKLSMSLNKSGMKKAQGFLLVGVFLVVVALLILYATGYFGKDSGTAASRDLLTKTNKTYPIRVSFKAPTNLGNSWEPVQYYIDITDTEGQRVFAYAEVDRDGEHTLQLDEPPVPNAVARVRAEGKLGNSEYVTATVLNEPPSVDCGDFCNVDEDCPDNCSTCVFVDDITGEGTTCQRPINLGDRFMLRRVVGGGYLFPYAPSSFASIVIEEKNHGTTIRAVQSADHSRSGPFRSDVTLNLLIDSPTSGQAYWIYERSGLATAVRGNPQQDGLPSQSNWRLVPVNGDSSTKFLYRGMLVYVKRQDNDTYWSARGNITSISNKPKGEASVFEIL